MKKNRDAASRLPRLALGTLAVLAVCALGAAPTQSCGPLPGGGGSDGGPPMPRCGDGLITNREQCDGANLAGKTCNDVPTGGLFVGGSLRCDPNTCTFDTRACTSPVCGNGVIEKVETCERNDLQGVACDPGSTGTVTCNAVSCQHDARGCKPATCGNGLIDGEDECDGTNLRGETCDSLEGVPGTLRCFPNCTYDRRRCSTRPGFCGNGIIEPDHEQCDGPMTCSEYAVRQGLPADYYLDGPVECDPATCNVFAMRCIPSRARCGNGILERQYNETCDGADLGGATCAAGGFPFGTPRCSQSCELDYFSGCWGGCISVGRTIYCQ